MARNIIYKSDHITVVVSEYESPVVVATFNEMGLVADGDTYWGSRAFEDQRITAIGFVSARPSWFPIVDMLEAIQTVNRIVAGRRLITYGFSQGGYGALKFSNLLNASVAVAFSPQHSINPEDVSAFDQRFISFYTPKLRNGERILQHDLCKRNLIVFDPKFAPDRLNANKLLQLDGVVSVPAPFSNHDTIRVITEGKGGRRLIELYSSCVDIDARDIRNIVRQSRRRSLTYAYGKLAQLESSIARHARFLQTALDALPTGISKEVGYIRSALAKGNIQLATDRLRELSDDDLLDFDIISFWHIFRESGFRYGEWRSALLLKRRYPTNMFMRLHGVSSMINVGLKEEALQELSELSSMPGAHSHAGHFITFYNQLNRKDVAALFARSFTDQKSSDQDERWHIGLELLKLYSAYNMRNEVFYEILELRKCCIGNGRRLHALVDTAQRHNLLSVIDLIVAENAALFAHSPVVQILAAQILSSKDSDKGAQHLRRLFSTRSSDYRFWNMLSFASERLLSPDYALSACKKSVRFAGKDDLAIALQRLAHIYLYTSRRRACGRTLKQMTKITPAPLFLFGELAKIALQADENKLAVFFAEGWLNASPANIGRQIECAGVFGQSGMITKSGDLILKVLSSLESGAFATRQQFIELIAIAQPISFALEYKAIAIACRTYPLDSMFERLASTERKSFARKFGVVRP